MVLCLSNFWTLKYLAINVKPGIKVKLYQFCVQGWQWVNIGSGLDYVLV
jgi:hypothetical protein